MMRVIALLIFCLKIFSNEWILQQQWDAFSREYPSLEALSPEDIAGIANAWGEKVSIALLASISHRNERKVVQDAALARISHRIRQIDPSVVKELVVLLRENKPKVFMRHGEQEKTERTRQLGPIEQKIEMMRLPENMQNGLTTTSIAEWMEGMIIWEYLRQRTSRSFVLESSENRRAKLPASSLAYALKTDVRVNECFNCINYPSNHQISTPELLKWIPDGTLPWKKIIVDAVTSPGTYERIVQEMGQWLSFESNAILIAITHTQQINAIATLLELPVIRLEHFGFIIVTEGKKTVFYNGFYASAHKLEVNTPKQGPVYLDFMGK